MGLTAAVESLPLVGNVALLLVSAASVWLGGAQLAKYCKAISEETGIGDAMLGTVLLGGIVSLRELTMSVTAALQAQAQLALSILLGGVTMAVLILAITDAAVGDEPLSSDIVSPVVLLQGALTILLLAVTAAGIVIHDVPLLKAGAWTTTIAVLYVIFLVIIDRYQKRRTWIPDDETPQSSSSDVATNVDQD